MVRAVSASTATLLILGVSTIAAEDHFSVAGQDIAVGAAYETIASGDFRIGSKRFDWDHGDRAALAFRTRVGGLQRVETVGGIDLYGDWRQGDTPEGTLKDRTLGFDLQCALALHLAQDPSRAVLDISAAPFLRAGIAWHELSLDDVETSSVRVVDEVSGARYALAFGADARLVIASRFEAYIGGGLQFWTSGTLTVNGYSGSQPVSKAVSYSGQEAFVHLGAMIWLDR